MTIGEYDNRLERDPLAAPRAQSSPGTAVPPMEPAPEAGAGPVQGPGHATVGDVADPYLDRDARERLAARLHHAVTGFVDSPYEAIAEADRVHEEAARHVTEALTRRRGALRAVLQTQHTGTETEELRLALRQYREATERLLTM